MIKIRNLLKLSNAFASKSRLLSSALIQENITILGIETSCDDTGVALINSHKGVLGEALYSQEDFHLKYGGIIPPRAEELHRENIEKAVAECLEKSSTDFTKIDAIAVTNRPGLPLSLKIGVRYAKHLARQHLKPIIPIHHMEAHSLSVRLEQPVPLPFLCLLISGGHSQLVVVKNANEYYLLGHSLDDAPGEAFDKIARRLKLRNIPRFEHVNGGVAIELAASEAENVNRYEFPLPLAREKDCQFSFAGMKNSSFRRIKEVELENDLKPDEIIPYYQDFCGGLLKGMTRHISNRTQRAIEYCEIKNIFKTNDGEELPRSLVISGGCACNDYIFTKLELMANHYNYKTFRPSKKLCRDNGIMIAWNAIEKYNLDKSCLIYEKDFEDIDIVGKCSIGENLVESVTNEHISCKWIQVKYSFIISGTPGTGKSTLCEKLAEQLKLNWQDVSKIAKDNDFIESMDEDLNCPIIDEDKVLDYLEPKIADGGNVVEYHSCEFFPERFFDAVYVLRCNNTTLFDRLNGRNYSDDKIKNNIECEIFQTILDEAKESYDKDIIFELRGDKLEDLDENIKEIKNWYNAWIQKSK